MKWSRARVKYVLYCLAVEYCLVQFLWFLFVGSYVGCNDIEMQKLYRMREIAVALRSYQLKHDRLPRDIVAPDGTPLWSWRVHLLPDLSECEEIHRQLRLDEPWNSDFNRPLVAQAAKAFQVNRGEAGRTPFLAVVGPGTAFSADALPIHWEGGAVMLCEVREEFAVPWAQPGGDISASPDEIERSAGRLPRRARWVGRQNGSTECLRGPLPAAYLRQPASLPPVKVN